MRLSTLNELADIAPHRSLSKTGQPMEPINLVIVGSYRDIKAHFRQHGWYKADLANVTSILKSFWALVSNSEYDSGPFNKGYVFGKPHAVGFEKPTKSANFKRRHHLRLWKTPYIWRRQKVWLGTLSYDRGIALGKTKIVPIHHINPNLNLEEDFLARSLGVNKPIYLNMAPGGKGRINTGDPYLWDGRALLLEL